MPFKVTVIDQLRQHALHKRGNGAGVKAELLLIHLDKMKGEHHITYTQGRRYGFGKGVQIDHIVIL